MNDLWLESRVSISTKTKKFFNEFTIDDKFFTLAREYNSGLVSYHSSPKLFIVVKILFEAFI